ncbi:MAG: DNA/RNA nuclease SfsA [Thermosulfidibacteraceae bacterium]|jgi:sugar fermentation stimulation protein A
MLDLEKVKGIFKERVNRFVCLVDVGGEIVSAYLPNPGRLWELLIPGTEVLLVRSLGGMDYIRESLKSRKHRYVLIATKRFGRWVLLHTHLTNRIVRDLIGSGRIEFLKGFKVVREEVDIGNRRIDFLLEGDGGRIYLEVKTCTLFGRRIAMFPDAVTKRGSDHVVELSHLVDRNTKSIVLFVIMNPAVDYFLPTYHIDREFAKNMLKFSDLVEFRAISIGFNECLKEVREVKEVRILWDHLRSVDFDKGVYLLVIELDRPKVIKVGALGELPFEKGFYVYVGSAFSGLKGRIGRHKNRNKKLRWHIDYLTSEAKRVDAIPIVTTEDIEEELAEKVSSIADDCILRFGASDSLLESHLFFFRENPIKNRDFVELVCYYRLDRILGDDLEDSRPF